MFSASCRSQLKARRQPYSKTRRLVAVWLSASRVHKMLGAKLGFRVHITSADLLPSTAGPTSRYNASSVFSAATLPGRLTGILRRELSLPNYSSTDSVLRILRWTRTTARQRKLEYIGLEEVCYLSNENSPAQETGKLTAGPDFRPSSASPYLLAQTINCL